MAADDALQVRRSHATESAMLILATLFFIFSSFLVVSEIQARYVRGDPSNWEKGKNAALQESDQFIRDLDKERVKNGLAPEKEEDEDG